VAGSGKLDRLSGVDKAAILLLSLGEGRAGDILSRLDDREVQLLGQKISKLEFVPVKQMANILRNSPK
jgi:flagellar motor switch protein FliG